MTVPEADNRELRRIDPARSACVLIGVDAYTELDRLPGVTKNLAELKAVLTDKRIWGVPEDRVRVVPNPRTAAELVDPVREMAKRAEDALLVYYSGHGLIDPDEDQLYLTLTGTVRREPDTAVPFRWVRRAIKDHGSARCRAVILDCCYSGKALEQMADGTLDVPVGMQDVQGSYFMTSTAQNRRALAAGREGRTVFTGTLVDVLRGGVPAGPQALSLGDCFMEVRARLRAADKPVPEQQDRNGVGLRPFVRNLALLPAPAPVPPQETRRRRTARRAMGAGAAALVFVAGMTVPPGEHWLRDHVFPRRPGGPCSPDATLLSYSDALDGVAIEDEEVSGLSSLALTGPSTAYVLPDNNPGRIFPVTLRGPGDSPDRLAPRARTATTLRRADGSTFGSAFDGEGMVLEKGGRTVLVASEVGPAIRRFSVAAGREIGEPLPIPKPFMTVENGGQAQDGRTLESLAATPDGHYLYAGLEAPLGIDGDSQGSYLLRIERYRGTPGGRYTMDRQYAFETDAGLYLSELAVVGNDQLLALERNYIGGVGNAVRVYTLSLGTAKSKDVTDIKSLYQQPADTFADTGLLFDLADCPAGSAGQVKVPQTQPNPLLDNVEGMAVTAPATTGRYRGWRTLYLVSDNNGSRSQVTRLYELRIRVTAP